ncbi:hypothetical protein EUX98_g2714 [Antrodiella citrinella]|uniref:Uncharacterized protein n=1 Tax=Antrodiella citrinella TaxID=2447956 RepID=A0A4S4MZP7_9APHY|nr:hypothetical protein EUX98_g2714 [Antrodiella citrinella]
MASSTSPQPRASLTNLPHSVLPPDPSVPPNDGRCIINELPTELLSHIFLLGWILNSKEIEAAEKQIEDEYQSRMEKAMNDFGSREYPEYRPVGVDVDVAAIPQDDGDSDYEDVEDEDRQKKWFDEDNWELLVTQVCKRWREVAIGTPQLWSNLNFSDTASLEKPITYLERSKGAPITISIDYTEDDNSKIWNQVDGATAESRKEDLLHRYRTICEIIRPHLSHTQSLEIMVTFWKYMVHTLHFLAQIPEAPELEVLQLYHYEDSDDDDDEDMPQVSSIGARDREPQPILFHGNVPRLIDLTLWGVHLNWGASMFLSGLHVLQLAYHEEDLYPPFKDFARILRDSPDLEHLRRRRRAVAPKELSTTITLPSVKEFSLAYVDCGYAVDLMERLVFPSLATLSLDVEDGDYSPLVSLLAKPHRVSGKSVLANLTALHLQGIGECERPAIAEAMGTLQNVTTLRMNFNFLSRDWYHALLPGSTDVMPATHGVTAPRLDTLYSSGLEGDDLTALVKARTAVGVPLSKLYVERDDGLTEEEEWWFKERSGLKVFDYFENSDDEDEDDDGSIIDMDLDDNDDFWENDEIEDEDDEDEGEDDDDEDEDEDEDEDNGPAYWLGVD